MLIDGKYDLLGLFLGVESSDDDTLAVDDAPREYDLPVDLKCPVICEVLH